MGVDARQQNALALIKIYEDPGRSGATIERPGLSDLLRDAKQRAFKKVIVWRLDRWSRDLYQGLWLSKELLVHGTEVVSISEPFNGQDPLFQASSGQGCGQTEITHGQKVGGNARGCACASEGKICQGAR